MSLTVTFPSQTTVADRDLATLELIHRAERRSTRTLVAALRSIDPADVDEVAQVRTWFDHVHPALTRHHQVVEQVLVPALVEVDPTAQVLVGSVAAGHAHVAARLDRLAAAIDGLEGQAGLGASEAGAWQLRQAVTAAEEVVTVVDDDVRREQASVARSMVGTVSKARWDEVQGELVLHADPSTHPFTFPWLAQGCSEVDEHQLVLQLPRMLRVVHRFVWKPAHEHSYPLLVAAGRRVDRSERSPHVA